MREMKKTCKYILSVIACNVVLSLTAIAAEISWKGGGGTSVWSDGTNWQGGTSPSAGDTAVIPDGKTAYMSSVDITWAADRLSLIKLPGIDSTLYITNNTASVMTVPVEGIGKYNVSNNNVELKFAVDNLNFTGPFCFINSKIRNDYDHGKCFGRYNVVTNFVGNGVANLSIFKSGNYDNTWYIFGGSSVVDSGRSLFTYGPIDLRGPVYIDGDYAVAPQQGTTLTFSGGIHHSGARKIRFNNKIAITGGVPCDFQTTTAYNTGICVGGGTLTLESPLTATSPRIGGPGLIKFGAANLLHATTGLHNGGDNNVRGLKIDLNGFDQQCGTIYKADNGGQTEDNSYITSPVDSPAKLTVYGQLEWYGNQPDADNRYMAFSIRGAASLELNGTNVIKTSGGVRVWPKMEIRNCPTKSDTTGGLCVRRGTLTLAETTYWPNLSRLEAHDEGLLVMNTDGVNTNGFVFVVSNVVDSAVTIAAGKHLHAKSAYVGKWLEPGEYGGAGAGLDAKHTLPQLGGSGTVHVKEWGGPKGIIFIFK